MKSFVGLILLLGIFATTVFGAKFVGNYTDPKNPGKCTISDDLVLSPGDSMKDPKADCARVICGDDGFAQFHTCGVAVVSGCTMGDYIDKSLPYPECCARQTICT